MSDDQGDPVDDDQHDASTCAWHPMSRGRSKRPAIAILVALTLPSLADAACQIETVEMPVRMVGSRATAVVGINGTEVPLTVDSGSPLSILTDAAAEQLKLPLPKRSNLNMQGATGKLDVRKTIVDKLKLFKGDIDRVTFMVGVNEPGVGTMGLMGRNILSLGDAEYDLAHGVIRLSFPGAECARSNMAYWAGSTNVTEVDLMSEYGSTLPAIRATVRLNGHDVIALFDTGATTIVSARAARRAGVDEKDWKPSGLMYGAGRGSAKTWTAPFETFELGDEKILHNRLTIGDFDSSETDMLLGIDFFLSHRIYVSKQQSKIFFTYNGGPVFTRDRGAGSAAGADPAVAGSQTATADELARRGAASTSRRDYDSALADLDRACELAPTSATYFAQRGAIQEALKRPAKAIEDYDRALELDPAQVDARFQRAGLRFGAKNRDGAKADLDTLDRSLPPQAQMRLSLSQFYLALDQPAQALAQLNQWLPAHPNEVRRDIALNNRCWARVLLGVELDRAIDDCDGAISGSNGSGGAGYFNTRGWAYLRAGRYGRAVSDFDRSLEGRAANASSLYGRGLAKTRSGDTAAGDADLAAARKLQPEIDARMTRLGLTGEIAAKP